MTRNQRKIDKIQREIAKLIDIGATTEIQDGDVRFHLLAAQRSLDAAYLLA